jgi:hypothetical protein
MTIGEPTRPLAQYSDNLGVVVSDYVVWGTYTRFPREFRCLQERHEVAQAIPEARTRG